MWGFCRHSGCMRTLKLILAYDGTDFAGWQQQPGRRTVQGVLAAALRRLTGEEIQPIGSGRTDAGVHALGQAASFQTRSTLPAETIERALNALLPLDVRVLAARDAPPEFHAVRHARRKRYRYLIDDSSPQDPFLRRYAWQVRQPLDARAMHGAGQALAGCHDFASFQTTGSPRANTVRTIFSLAVHRARTDLHPARSRAGEGGEKTAAESSKAAPAPYAHPSGAGEGGEPAVGSIEALAANETIGSQHERQAVSVQEGEREAIAETRAAGGAPHAAAIGAGQGGGVPHRGADTPESSPGEAHHSLLAAPTALFLPAKLVVVEIEADGFLYNMARAIVGTLVEVGQRRRPESWVAQVLAARDRRRAGKTAPPQGLYLVEVQYDVCWT